MNDILMYAYDQMKHGELPLHLFGCLAVILEATTNGIWYGSPSELDRLLGSSIGEKVAKKYLLKLYQLDYLKSCRQKGCAGNYKIEIVPKAPSTSSTTTTTTRPTTTPATSPSTTVPVHRPSDLETMVLSLEDTSQSDFINLGELATKHGKESIASALREYITNGGNSLSSFIKDFNLYVRMI